MSSSDFIGVYGALTGTAIQALALSVAVILGLVAVKQSGVALLRRDILAMRIVVAGCAAAIALGLAGFLQVTVLGPSCASYLISILCVAATVIYVVPLSIVAWRVFKYVRSI